MPLSLPDDRPAGAPSALAPGVEAAGPPESPLLVVGLGASAGGIEALERFFHTLPAAPGAAFVVVLHLSPDHESHLAEILQTATAMPVRQVRGVVRTEADHVYVIPPGRSLSMADGTLELSTWSDETDRRAPIDLFFRTLGQQHPHCAAVILSGFGADGSVGIAQVREAGGLVLAQDPADALHDSMPRCAIDTGLVDDVGTAEALADRVAAHAAGALARLPDEPRTLPENDAEALVSVLVSLRVQTGHDFAHYKRATVMRRISRRMHVHRTPTLAAYAVLVRERPEETAALLQDLLISVTNFFRDRDAFRTLETEVIPRLFEGKGPGDTVRVWSAGCATGEEAYGLAILLAEYAGHLESPPACQVFASDIDEDALARAREGRYSTAIVADVSDERLARFFTAETGYVVVRKELREQVLFASHSLIKDPPFSRVDLVVCRNLLIYLQREVQVRVFETFHFALRPDGYLFLGASESGDSAAELFRPLNGPHRVFQRRASTRVARVPTMPGRGSAARRPPEAVALPPRVGALAGDVHQHLLEAYAPPSAVVDERHEIVHLTETAGRFLHVPAGVPTSNIVRAVLPELQLELRLALHRAFQQGKPTVGGPVRAHIGSEDVLVLLIVRPTPRTAGDGLALVLFAEVEDELATVRPSDGQAGPLVAALEADLSRARERLQASAEEHETSMEELRASNEELQSLNEEYRSATEEIETSREELQSVNEELETVNHELKARIDEVTRVHSDLQQLMASTEIGTLFVDRDLLVRRYTPPVAHLFDMTGADRGRSLLHITHRLHDVDLTAAAAGVLASLAPVEHEVRTHDGETYLVRIRPYRTVGDHIEGVVLTFVDVTERTRAEAALHQSEARLRLATDFGGVALGIWDLATGRLHGDARLAFLYGLDEAAVTSPEGIDSAALFARVHPDDLPALEAALAREIAHSTDDYTVEYRAQGADGVWRWLQVRAGVERGADGHPVRFAGAILDVTARVHAEEARAEGEARYQSLFTTIDEGFALCEMTTDDAGAPVSYRFLDANPAFKAMTGLDVVGKTVGEIVPGEEAAWVARFAPAALHGETVRFEESAIALGQTFSVYASPAAPAGSGRFTQVFSDVTAQKQTEAVLEAVAHRAAFRIALADAIRPIADPVQVQEVAARLLGEHVEASRVFYAEMEPDDAHAVIHRDYTADMASFSGRYRIDDFGPALVGELRAGRTLVLADVPADAQLGDAEQATYAVAEICAAVGVPIVKHGRLVGIFGVHQCTPRAWTPDEVALVEEVAERTWAAVERACAEEAVRESEERLSLLVEGAQEYAFVGTDVEGRIQTWSAGAARIFGWAEAEAVGQMVRMIYTAEDQAAHVPEGELDGARDRGQVPDERWHVRKDGGRFWASGTMNALRDAAGDLRGYAKVLRDNSRRRDGEQALADSEARFRRAIEAAAVPVMLYADDGEILAVSDATVAITGYTRDDIQTLDTWLALVHGPEDALVVAALLADGFAGRLPIGPVELDVRTRSGDTRTWVFSAGGPETLRDGRLFYAGFASDVTERKRAEAALRVLNETLDARVTERTQALEVRTRQARALAGALTLAEQRERNRIAQVLHDHVQQLLYGVQIKLHLLPADAPDAVGRIAGEIGTLVGDALQATRALTVELSPPVLQGEGLTAALRWLATQMEGTHGLRVSVEATGNGEATGGGDSLSEERRVLVFQLVRELLFNVVKHAGVAEARVAVDEGPALLTVCVEDAGRGFDDQPTDAHAPGGFGLVSLRQRLDPLGGRIVIASPPGEGTRVTIELPM